VAGRANVPVPYAPVNDAAAPETNPLTRASRCPELVAFALHSHFSGDHTR
jgi:hypothetical protein